MNKGNRVLIMSVFWAALLLVLCFVSDKKDLIADYEFNTCVLCAVFCLVPYLFYRFRAFKLPLGLIVLIHLAIFLHAVGVLFFAYDLIKVYDNVTHTFSSMVVSACVMLTLLSLQRYNPKIHFTMGFCSLMVLLVMMSFGVIWEEFEYVVDLTTGTKMQYCPWDTLRDMLCNTLGSVICSICMAFYLRNRSVDAFIDSMEIHPILRAFLEEKKSDVPN